MGYFANLYLIEVGKVDDTTEVKTTIYGGAIDGYKAYFSWGDGERPNNKLRGFANDTIYTDTDLWVINGPIIEQSAFGKDVFIDASFNPMHSTDPVIYHVVLDECYVPNRDADIFEQPSLPSIYNLNGKLLVTYPVVGSTALRFWITQNATGARLNDRDLPRLVRPKNGGESKLTVGTIIGSAHAEYQFEA